MSCGKNYIQALNMLNEWKIRYKQFRSSRAKNYNLNIYDMVTNI